MAHAATGSASPYDEVPYPARAFIQTHPDRLATLAALHGMRPAPPARCRVLELGCGHGANLLPMAITLPGATFVGIDNARRPIARAQALTAGLELANISFEEISLEDYEPDAGSFDYVIAHGVYSWVPEPVRKRIMQLSAHALSEHGVAYVSYNAKPGGLLRQGLREMLAFHLDGIDDPAERLTAARGFLGLLSAAGDGDDDFARTFGPQARSLFEHVDGLLFHDTLSAINDARYFHEFAAHAAGHGLQFLSESEFSEMQLGALPPQLRQALLTIDDPIKREQYLDFLKERMFRQTLLCRAAVALQRPPLATALHGMAVSGPLRWTTDEDSGKLRFVGPGGANLTTDIPTITRVLQRIGSSWPAAPWISELGDETEQPAICDALLRCFGANLVRLHVAPPPLSAVPGERPRTTALARLEAEQGPLLTTLRHTQIRIDDDLNRRVVGLLDGTRDRAALLAALEPEMAQSRAELTAALERSLQRLAGAGLLLNGGVQSA